MAGKLPYFQFYPDDWLSDEELRACSDPAKALWIDLLCIMHKCEHRGTLAHRDGTPYTPEEIARQTGRSPDEVVSALRELRHVALVESGCIFSKRMRQDEEKRQAYSRSGAKGGRPKSERQSEMKANALDHPKGIPKPNESALSGDGDGIGNGTGIIRDGEGAGGEGLTPAIDLAQQFSFTYVGSGRTERNPIAMAGVMQDLLNRGISFEEIRDYINADPKVRPRTQRDWQFLQKWEAGNDARGRSGNAQNDTGKPSISDAGNENRKFHHNGREEVIVPYRRVDA